MLADGRILCGVCGRREAFMSCDHCGKPLCPDCRRLELWGSGAEDLSAKYFCPACKDNPDINPWGAREHNHVPNQSFDPSRHGRGRRSAQTQELPGSLNRGSVSNSY